MCLCVCACMHILTSVVSIWQSNTSRRQIDTIYADLRRTLRSFPKREDIWLYRDQLPIPAIKSFGTRKDQAEYGHGRYVDTKELVYQILQTRSLGMCG